jgi:hypothetical protein
MGLLPEEEEAFVRITSELRDLRSRRVSWPILTVCGCLLAIGVAGGALFGVPAVAMLVYCVTFVVALATGLIALALSDKRRRRAR